jgi:hypothetical protein
MKTLSFSKDRVRVLVSAELGSVFGGQDAAQPTATAVSSALNGGGVAQPTATAVSSALNGGGVAQPTATAVSSAAPVVHKHHHHKVSSALPTPTATAVSSALPNGGNVSSALPSS